ncbi:hypothetical protein MLD38_007461 [Melastoma candidum]|uniref:Uncharacterized protein n=1 Tax=Melastoma candidum TaxID=119954 RepID=A0ACB9RR68_9MYRT|nr:hypothetical protein MLD38_007461 [Melastoma candidum]
MSATLACSRTDSSSSSLAPSFSRDENELRKKPVDLEKDEWGGTGLLEVSTTSTESPRVKHSRELPIVGYGNPQSKGVLMGEGMEMKWICVEGKGNGLNGVWYGWCQIMLGVCYLSNEVCGVGEIL